MSTGSLKLSIYGELVSIGIRRPEAWQHRYRRDVHCERSAGAVSYDAYQPGLVHLDFRQPEVEDFHLARRRQHQGPNGDFGRLPTDNKSGRRIVQLGVRFLF